MRTTQDILRRLIFSYPKCITQNFDDINQVISDIFSSSAQVVNEMLGLPDACRRLHEELLSGYRHAGNNRELEKIGVSVFSPCFGIDERRKQILDFVDVHKPNQYREVL